MSEDPVVGDPGPLLDLATTPLSYPGSWLSVSRVVGQRVVADDPHLVSHRFGPEPILRLTPEVDGHVVEAELRATPEGFTWTHGSATIQLTFVDAKGFRLRGSGLDLRLSAVAPELTPFSGTYAFGAPEGGWVFTNYATGFRYLVMPLSGCGQLIGDQALGRADRAVVMRGDVDSVWELDVREASAGTPTRPADHTSIEDLRRNCRSSYEAFRRPFGPIRDQPTGDLAAYVLWSSLVSPEGFVRRPAMLMSKNWMDKIWAWDPCFNAIALASAHPDLAWDQLLVVFDHQDVVTGAIPDSVTHSQVLFNFVKPPIHGWALREVRRRLARPLSRQELTIVYDRLSRWSRFWLDTRRAPGHSLPYYEHGNDSGWDNATTFDRDRLIESPDLASFLVIQLDVLAELAGELGLDPDVRSAWQSGRDALLEALLDELWDGEQFVAKSVQTGRVSTATSLLNLMPLVIADRLPEHVTDAMASQLRAHLTEWGLATEVPTSERYESDGYWRGPIWGPPTVLVEYGLRVGGYDELADIVRTRYLALCAKSGFAENFDAISGAGLRDRAYTWTASSYLLFACDEATP